MTTGHPSVDAARRGIGPTAELPPLPPFNLVEWRREQAALVLRDLIPQRFQAARLDNAEVAEWVRDFLADPVKAPLLLLGGPTGTGKTWLVYAALREIVEQRAERGKGIALRVTSHPRLNDALRPKSDGSHEHALDPYLAAELVVLDDLGAGKQTEWTADSLYRLIDRRWAANQPVIFTTNMVPAALSEAVGDRVVSRLGDAVRVTLKGTDRRWAGQR